jgi:hypothetical protein
MLDRSPVAIEAVFRTKYGELCASLLSAFGYQRFDLFYSTWIVELRLTARFLPKRVADDTERV